MVLEARSRDYVESRVRAGVLEQGTVDLMADLGVDARLRRESMIDEALDIRFSGKLIHLNLPGLSGGKLVHIYGQQEVVKDLIAANLARGVPILFEAEATGLDGLTGDTARDPLQAQRQGRHARPATSSPAATASTASAAPRSPPTC